MQRADVPASRIYSIRDIVADAQYEAREMIREIRLAGGGTLKVPGVVPKLVGHAGRLRGRRTAARRAHATTCCASWATTDATIAACARAA